MMFIISLAFLFILKLRFPSNRPITGTRRRKYGGQAVHNLREWKLSGVNGTKHSAISTFLLQ